MGNIQEHRGPDAWGEWVVPGIALGHNRLSIIDHEGGTQPMHSLCSNISVVFNGEIYNHIQLRDLLTRKGYKFKSDHSDTETIVNGFLEWGTEVFNKLEGMFSIAIVDRRNKELIIARDRLGIKPLYYGEIDGGFIFASEPKTIINSGLIKKNINYKSLQNYFYFRSSVGKSTLINNINRLDNGSYIKYSYINQKLNQIFYWTNRSATNDIKNMNDAIDIIEDKLKTSIYSHLISDVPIGLFLSGGVDSSLIAAITSLEQKLDAFTVSTDSEHDESIYAKKVASHLGINLFTLKVTPQNFLDSFDKWAFHNDDPVSDPSALALMLLSEKIKNSGYKVVLSGEGSDEIFGGYNSYRRFKFYNDLSRIPGISKFCNLFSKYLPSKEKDYISRINELTFLGTAHTLTDDSYENIFNDKKPFYINSENYQISCSDLIRSAMLFDQNIRLPNDVLMRTDRASMAYSIEARVPFLDYKLVDVANKLSTKHCVSKFRSKIILKKIAEKYLPRDIIYRKKKGFDLPISNWIRNDFQPLIHRFLSEKNIAYINYKGIEEINRKNQNQEYNFSPNIWQWLIIEIWNQKFIKQR